MIHLPQELKAHRGGSCKHKLQYYITITTTSTDKKGSVQTNKYRQTSTSTTSTNKQIQTKKDRLAIAQTSYAKRAELPIYHCTSEKIAAFTSKLKFLEPCNKISTC